MNKETHVKIGTSAGAASLSIASNCILIVLKVVVGALSGSVSIISEAIHSAIDLAASGIAYLAIRLAHKPADSEHTYGHEKIENVSGVVEAALIFAAAGLIIVESIRKILDFKPMDHAELGALVMLVSALANLLVSRRLYAVARKERSVALEADALHHKTDVYSSLGVAIALVVILLVQRFLRISWIVFLDPVAAIAIACFILKEAWSMIRTAFGPLIDAGLPEEEVVRIEALVSAYKGVKMHAVRSRSSGGTNYLDFHLSVDESMSVRESHELCDEIERVIRKELPGANVLIHTEPILAPRVVVSPALTKDELLFRLGEIGHEIAGYEVRPHHLHIFDGGGWTEITFHIDIKAGSTVEEAHRIASGIEDAVSARLGYTATIHVEPAKAP